MALQHFLNPDQLSAVDNRGQLLFAVFCRRSSQVSIGALIAWVVRLLVMYDPLKRRRWGRYTNEKRLFRGLIWTFVLLETGACVSGAVNGLAWCERKANVRYGSCRLFCRSWPFGARLVRLPEVEQPPAVPPAGARQHLLNNVFRSSRQWHAVYLPGTL